MYLLNYSYNFGLKLINMKYIFSLLVVLFAASFAFGQKNIEYINKEVKKVEVQLNKKGEHLQLSNVQKDKLYSIFAEKYKRVELFLSKDLEKKEVSNGMTKIEDEFRPRIESVLNLDQRLAVQKKRKTASTSK